MHVLTRSPRTRALSIGLMVILLAAACGTGGQATPVADTPPAGTPSGTPPEGMSPEPASPGPGTGGEVIMLSTQLAPLEEAEKMRNAILAEYPGGFPAENFVPAATAAEFTDRAEAEANAGEGNGEVSLFGALHGDLSILADAGQLTDLSDLADELGDLGLLESYVELGRFGTDQQLMIPWMQATYIMAASQEAMEYLPEDADQNALTWEDVTEWGRNIADAGHGQRLGFPAGPDGLWHRFFQGFALPAFTGRVNTAFNTPEAVEMWSWLEETWEFVNPQSSTYGFMQDPLQSGEVWVAWDHVARLRDAFTANPEGYVALPAPAGPQGRAFMPVVAGLAIPASAPNPEGARELIRYLVSAETSAVTLREVGFFPATEAELPAGLDPGIQNMSDAVVGMTGASDALPALLPVGLGEQNGAYNQVFRDVFESVVIGGQDIQTVLDQQTPNLQAVFDTSGAACWSPDPPSDGPCQVQGAE
ncbi:MAG TPA: extracellular solute-binding protein [Candidatus Limnocylindria bacterium]|nr:extracellular solute-binding protein [Candidatus Limnocylindria bacterium]